MLRFVLAALVLAVLAGCGRADAPRPDPPAVGLSIVAPLDSAVVREATLELRGRVSPARASVRVLGRDAPVVGGEFSARVPLERGANVIDVSASMPGRSPAFSAVRVTFDPRVEVPDLTGVIADDAADRLSALGLDPSVEHVGGLFDEFRSGDRRVCESDPPPGSRLDPGDEVLLSVAKRC